ncbi:MAG TPA: hypothetical protein VFB80_24190 [Pirellulaceae bacterium]|nr:hypothetical protein [Pirellulaceae bacterium]
MRRLLLAASLTLPVLSSGCALCCAPFDCHYPYVGGAWVRTDPVNGRVGSAFYNAGAPAGAVPVAATEPTPAQPGAMPTPAAPGARSVIPRNMGEGYLP